MTSLIDPTTTESFYTALENAQEDYQDFKETYESLRDFFNAGRSRYSVRHTMLWNSTCAIKAALMTVK